MASDGMLPKVLSKYRKGNVLIIPLIAQAVVAFIASLTNDISGLIFFSFVLLSISIIAGCFAYSRLLRYYTRKPYENPKPAYSVFLIIIVMLCILSQIPPTPLLVAIIVLLFGVPVYLHLSPKCEIADLKDKVLSQEYNESYSDIIRGSYLGVIFTNIKKSLRGE